VLIVNRVFVRAHSTGRCNTVAVDRTKLPCREPKGPADNGQPGRCSPLNRSSGTVLSCGKPSAQSSSRCCSVEPLRPLRLSATRLNDALDWRSVTLRNRSVHAYLLQSQRSRPAHAEQSAEAPRTSTTNQARVKASTLSQPARRRSSGQGCTARP